MALCVFNFALLEYGEEVFTYSMYVCMHVYVSLRYKYFRWCPVREPKASLQPSGYFGRKGPLWDYHQQQQ